MPLSAKAIELLDRIEAATTLDEINAIHDDADAYRRTHGEFPSHEGGALGGASTRKRQELLNAQQQSRSAMTWTGQ